MAIIKILPEHKSNTTVEFSPRRIFSSGSGGLTGSINVIVNRSPTQRDSIDMREGLTNTEGPQKFTENTFEGRRDMIYNARFNTVGQGNIFSEAAVPYNFDLQLGLLMDGANVTDAEMDGAASVLIAGLKGWKTRALEKATRVRVRVRVRSQRVGNESLGGGQRL